MEAVIFFELKKSSEAPPLSKILQRVGHCNGYLSYDVSPPNNLGNLNFYF